MLYIQKRAQTWRRLAGCAYLCDDPGRTSPRSGRRAGPPQVPSRQVSTVAEEASEKVRLESRKGPRSAESALFSTPSTTRFWISCIYLYYKQQQKYMAGMYVQPLAGILVRRTAVYSIITIYQVQVYSGVEPHTPRCLRLPKRDGKKGTASPPRKRKELRESNPRPRALRECKLLFNYPSFSSMTFIRLICIYTYE